MGTISSFHGEHFFLSNFYPFELVWDGATYPTVEHAYQASKTEDPALRRDIAHAGTPGGAKRMGRSVPLRPDWEDVKLDIMRQLIRLKFKDLDLRAALLTTGSSYLIEGNTWGDTYWGKCRGAGTNWLGEILMLVRDELVNENAKYSQNKVEWEH